MPLEFVESLPPRGRPVGSITEQPLPVLDMTDKGFNWTPSELEEAVRLMRNRLLEDDPELDEDLPRRAHLRKEKR